MDIGSLATVAGDTLVTAAVTDAWEAARQKVARLFGRGEPDPATELRLDKTQDQLAAATAADLERVQTSLAARWEGRLADLLETYPDAEAELRAIVEEIRMLLPGVSASALDHSVAASRNVSISADRGSVAAGVIHGDVEIHQAADLQSEVEMPVRAFLANFGIYLDHIGDMEAQLALLPKSIWPIKHVQSCKLTDDFIRAHHLQPAETVALGGQDLREALALVLKEAWERGYLMFKFHRFGYVPGPPRDVDPVAIMDTIIAVGSPDLSAGIEVILQRAVSLCTELEPVRERLIYASLADALDGCLGDWSAAVRSAHGWGILSAKAEGDLLGASSLPLPGPGDSRPACIIQREKQRVASRPGNGPRGRQSR